MVFKILMGDKTYIASSFINKNQDVAPEFVDEMRKGKYIQLYNVL